MDYIIIGSIVAVIVLILGTLLVLGSKKIVLTATEKDVMLKISDEESRLLSEYQVGKEDVIAEYERLKSRVSNVTSLKGKLSI